MKQKFTVMLSPCKVQVSFVVFQRFAVVLHVKICIAELTVDGAHRLEIFRPDATGSLEKLNAQLAVASLAQSLALQCQLEARGFAFPRRHYRKMKDRRR